VQRHDGGARLAGRAGAKYDENRAILRQKAMAAQYNRSLFQRFAQINGIFSPIEEFKSPFQSKNGRIRARRENGESGHLSALYTPGRRSISRWKSISAGSYSRRLAYQQRASLGLSTSARSNSAIGTPSNIPALGRRRD
jgi:hypothetical protein